MGFIDNIKDVTGAGGAIPRNDINRMNEHAERYYEEIRKRTGDIQVISKNTGFSIEDVQIIKNHIFFNKYDLGEEFPERFAPDYDMAVSWQRLIDGKNIHEMDLIMLNHELMEYNLMLNKSLSYYEAHELTQIKYNYIKYVKELNEKEGVR